MDVEFYTVAIYNNYICNLHGPVATLIFQLLLSASIKLSVVAFPPFSAL